VVVVVVHMMLLYRKKCLSFCMMICITQKLPDAFRRWFITLSQKNTNFETVLLKIIRMNFDDIWQKYSKYSRIELVCLRFHVGLLVITLSSLKLHAEI